MNENIASSGHESSNISAQKSSLADNMKSKEIWLRLFFMFVVLFLYSVSRIVVGAVVIGQFLWVLLTSERNSKLVALGQALATYTYQITLYLTFNTEERPFPFDAEWPDQD